MADRNAKSRPFDTVSARSRGGPARRILTIGAGLPPRSLMRRPWEHDIGIHNSAWNADALAQCREQRNDLIVVQYEGGRSELEGLMRELQREGSPSSEAHLLVLAETEQLAEMETLVGDRAHVVAASQPPQVLEAIVSNAMRVAPRRPARLIVRFEARIGGSRVLRCCQTVNLSTSGMLIRTREPLPIGTRLQLRLEIPGAAPIDTEGEVVRHTGERELQRGMGLKFLGLRGEREARLKVYLGGVAAE